MPAPLRIAELVVCGELLLGSGCLYGVTLDAGVLWKRVSLAAILSGRLSTRQEHFDDGVYSDSVGVGPAQLESPTALAAAQRHLLAALGEGSLKRPQQAPAPFPFQAMHRAWLDSDVVAAFNESVYYPYTSLKYHTLLVAALVDNYRDGELSTSSV